MLKRLALVLTYNCNLRCTYCYVKGADYGLNNENMTGEMARSIFDHFVEHFSGVEQIYFYGGEPLLALNTIRTLGEHVNQMFCNRKIEQIPHFGLVTNGTLISNEFIELAKKYNFDIIISIDGPSPIHDLHRRSALGCGTSEDIMVGIEKLKVAGLPFGIECTYTPDHLIAGYLPIDVYRYLGRLGARNISLVEVALPHPEKGLFDPEIFDDYLDTYLELLHTVIEESCLEDKPAHNEFIKILETLINRPENLEEHFCDAGITTFAVNPLGQTYPCHMLINRKSYYLGQYPQITRPIEILPKKSSLYECSDCSVKRQCRLCPARMYLTSKSGSIEPILENCRIFKASTRFICDSFLRGGFSK